MIILWAVVRAHYLSLMDNSEQQQQQNYDMQISSFDSTSLHPQLA